EHEAWNRADRCVSGHRRCGGAGVFLYGLPSVPDDDGGDLRDRHSGPVAADGIQWTDLAWTWGVFCDWRLPLGRADDVVECALLGDIASVGGDLRRRGVPRRTAGAAAGRALSGSDHVFA